MGKSKKVAIALNALVLPGIGHIYLGFKLKGILTIIATIFFLVIPIAKYGIMMTMAFGISSTKSTSAITNFVNSSSLIWPEVRNIVLLSVVGLFLIWIYGIVDIFLIFKKRGNYGM